jgi:hypothetical protein
MTSNAISRRAFLRSALGLAAGSLAATLPLAGCRQDDYTAPQSLAFLNAKEWRVLDAAARRLLPAGLERPSGGDISVASHADALFAQANPRLQADIKKLLNSFEDLHLLALKLDPFTAMPAEEQDRYLRAWMESPLGVQRQAFVGLNRISQMLYYMDQRSWPRIGFAGPWVGRLDVGYGLDNQGDNPAPLNPHVFSRYPA